MIILSFVPMHITISMFLIAMDVNLIAAWHVPQVLCWMVTLLTLLEFSIHMR